MVERFFSAPQTDLHHSQSAPILLLSGPPSSENGAILENAVGRPLCSSNSLSTPHWRPTLLCLTTVRLSSFAIGAGIDPSSDIFHRIQMKYVDDDEGINKFFAAFHLHDKFPHTVIIDDFGDLFDERNCQQRYNNPRGRDLAMVRILALCHNAIIHANETGPCKVLLSDTHHGDGSGSFLLKNNIYSGSALSQRMRTAKYSIALQYLVLEA
ncbi:unnamed protein product [Camellia sinensis]